MEDDLVQWVFTFLNARELALSVGPVCQLWQKISLKNALWDTLCDSLWADKVYIPAEIVNIRHVERNSKLAYASSIMDCKRDRITVEELCAVNWSFRFKTMAGNHFTEMDPWWNGLSARKVYFKSSGEVEYEFMAGLRRNWKFVKRAAGRSVEEDGHFIRVGEFPAYVVSRHPLNWGFIMQSCWVVYTSFEMPPVNTDSILEDANLDIDIQAQWFEASRYNSGLRQVDDPEAENAWRHYLRRRNMIDTDSEESETDGEEEEEEDVRVFLDFGVAGNDIEGSEQDVDPFGEIEDEEVGSNEDLDWEMGNAEEVDFVPTYAILDEDAYIDEENSSEIEEDEEDDQEIADLDPLIQTQKVASDQNFNDNSERSR